MKYGFTNIVFAKVDPARTDFPEIIIDSTKPTAFKQKCLHFNSPNRWTCRRRLQSATSTSSWRATRCRGFAHIFPWWCRHRSTSRLRRHHALIGSCPTTLSSRQHHRMNRPTPMRLLQQSTLDGADETGATSPKLDAEYDPELCGYGVRTSPISSDVDTDSLPEFRVKATVSSLPATGASMGGPRSPTPQIANWSWSSDEDEDDHYRGFLDDGRGLTTREASDEH